MYCKRVCNIIYYVLCVLHEVVLPFGGRLRERELKIKPVSFLQGN